MVYPRVCGGTASCGVLPQPHRSRSIPACAGEPGTDPMGRWGKAPVRSIPACAGEPYLHPLIEASRVHSRSIPACAGEPVRDNYGRYNLIRSIPACAGEPRSAGRLLRAPSGGLSPRVRGNLMTCKPSRLRPNPMVYPRVCGGTHLPVNPINTGAERSIPACAGEPLRLEGSTNSSGGSIPACAGEPEQAGGQSSGDATKVYPRVCGGTGCACGNVG